MTTFPLIKYPTNSNHETLYPKLTNVLKNDLPKIAHNQKVIDVINEITSVYIIHKLLCFIKFM